jgi:regulator of Ty1 transposition protein 103
MSYSEESLARKLEALEETQDSIVSTSQWVLFYYRYADKIASHWESYLKQCPTHKKLAMVYLMNDVVQQSRARKKTEFIEAFAKVLPEALNRIYPKVPTSTQKRLEKIVRVLNERHIFSPPLAISGVTGPHSDDRSASHSNGGALKGTDEEKIQTLASMGSKFQRFYHELLIGTNGVFTDAQLPTLNSLQKELKENISLLQELDNNVTKDIEKAQKRSKIQLEKTAEILIKQQKIEDQRRKEEEQRKIEERKKLEELKRLQEEENMLPAYQPDSEDDSDSNDSKTVGTDSDSGSDNEEIVHKGREVTEKKDDKKSSKSDDGTTDSEVRPKKRLRFAE